jgi:hypothetical protein
MEAIEFVSDPRSELTREQAHKSYLIKRGESWHAQSQSGTPMSLSNYSPNGTALQIALSRAKTTEDALAAFKEHAYMRYGRTAQIV